MRRNPIQTFGFINVSRVTTLLKLIFNFNLTPGLASRGTPFSAKRGAGYLLLDLVRAVDGFFFAETFFLTAGFTLGLPL